MVELERALHQAFVVCFFAAIVERRLTSVEDDLRRRRDRHFRADRRRDRTGRQARVVDHERARRCGARPLQKRPTVRANERERRVLSNGSEGEQEEQHDPESDRRFRLHLSRHPTDPYREDRAEEWPREGCGKHLFARHPTGRPTFCLRRPLTPAWHRPTVLVI